MKLLLSIGNSTIVIRFVRANNVEFLAEAQFMVTVSHNGNPVIYNV